MLPHVLASAATDERSASRKQLEKHYPVSTSARSSTWGCTAASTAPGAMYAGVPDHIGPRANLSAASTQCQLRFEAEDLTPLTIRRFCPESVAMFSSGLL